MSKPATVFPESGAGETPRTSVVTVRPDAEPRGAPVSGRPPRERLWMIGSIWLVSLLFAGSLTLADPDLWGHTLYGLRALEQGVLVEQTDPFSYTAPGAEWINHEWLSEYQFGLLWTHWGPEGLWLWRNVMLLAVFLVAAWSLFRSRATVAAAVALLVFNAECLSEFVIYIRPQLATFALFAVTLAVLRRRWETRTKAVWILPPAMLLWCNLHGGFLAGLGIQAAIVAGAAVPLCRGKAEAAGWPSGWENHETRRFVELAAVFGLSAAATLINPYGVELHRMLWHHLATEQPVREWQSLWEASQSPIYYVPFLLILLALPGFRRRNGIDLLVLAVVDLQATLHIRHVALLSVATLVLLPEPLSRSLQRIFHGIGRQWGRPDRRWLRASALGLVNITVIALAVRGVWNLERHGIHPWTVGVETRSNSPGMPVRMAALLQQEDLHGNLVTEYGWAQYLLWQLAPQTKIAFDGRYRTVYPAELERKFLAFQHGRGDDALQSAVLEDYPTEIALLRRDHPQVGKLDARDRWVRLADDEQAVLYVKDIPRFESLIERARKGRLALPDVPVWLPFPADAGKQSAKSGVVSSHPTSPAVGQATPVNRIRVDRVSRR